MGIRGLCTKNPVSTLTHRSIRPFRSHCEGFFATKEALFYSKKFYKRTTFGAKPRHREKESLVIPADFPHSGGASTWPLQQHYLSLALPGKNLAPTPKSTP